jgi:lysophospholipase L1-like esterase
MSTPPPGQRKGHWRKRLLLLLFSTLFCLLLLEGAVRVASALFFPLMLTRDDKLGWRHNPNRSKYFTNEDGDRNLVVLNEFGHRGKAHGLARAGGKHRILVLGDSFTEAVAVGEDQVFTRLVEASDADLEVLNTGVSSWGTVQQYLYLRDEGLRFHPDLVLVMYYANDLTDNCMPYSPGIGPRPHAVIEGEAVRIVEDYDEVRFLRFLPPVPFRSFLSRHSMLFYALNERVWLPSRMEEYRRILVEEEQALVPADTRRIGLHLLSEMEKLLDSSGIALAVVLIPSRSMMNTGRSDWYDEIRDFCGSTDIPCLSLLDAVIDAKERGQKPYFEADIHWNEQGHAIAARAMIPFLAGIRGRGSR